MADCMDKERVDRCSNRNLQRKKEKEREKDLGAMEASVHDFFLRSLLQTLARHQSLFQG
ncbi:unnamed protein product [Musa acuminata subsp. burmannicoides]